MPKIENKNKNKTKNDKNRPRKTRRGAWATHGAEKYGEGEGGGRVTLAGSRPQCLHL